MKRVVCVCCVVVLSACLETRAGASSGWSREGLDINRQIEEVAKTGGGRVTVPAGRWETKPIRLASNVELHFEDGADLLFTDDLEAFLPAVRTSYEGIECLNYSPLIYAYDATNIAITGKGKIEPRMGLWETWRWNGPTQRKAGDVLKWEWAEKDVPVESRDMTKLDGSKCRPQFICLNRCRGIRLEDFSLLHSPNWCIHLLQSEDAVLRRLKISAFMNNNDGVDIECSRNVLIEDCSFDQGDDVICCKSGKDRDGLRRGVPTENVTVRRCRAGAGHGFLVIGSECSGGVRNVLMEDCEVDGTIATLIRFKTRETHGGYMENITVRNVRARNVVGAVIDLSTGYSAGDVLPTGIDQKVALTRISGICIEDIDVKRAGCRMRLIGDARRPVTDFSVKGLQVGRTTSGDVVEFVQGRGLTAVSDL